MIDITNIIIIFWLHFIGDFILQSTYMGTNKSKDSNVLALHCFLYALPFLWFGLIYALLAGLTHFMVDFVTSRITSVLWKKEEVHWFFVIIGCDQAIHMTILMIMFNML